MKFSTKKYALEGNHVVGHARLLLPLFLLYMCGLNNTITHFNAESKMWRNIKSTKSEDRRDKVNVDGTPTRRGKTQNERRYMCSLNAKKVWMAMTFVRTTTKGLVFL